MSKNLTEQMQEKIIGALDGAFESVLESRNKHYQENPQKIPNQSEIDALIRASATINAAISGGASLIPGPWGMLAVVPELTAVVRNQIALIYDIGAAFGKKEMMSKELLLGVFVSAMGATAGSLLVLHGGKYMVRRASLSVFQKLITVLGGRITQQVLKSAISKWLPGIGAAAMAAWTAYLTHQIGKKAREILSHELANDPSTPDIELIAPIQVATASLAAPADDESLLEFYKLQVLIGLARIDGRISEQEERFITDALDSDEITSDQRMALTAQLAGESKPLQGLEVLSIHPDSAIALLSTMAALAKKDDDFHITEKLYIKQVGKLLGFSEGDIEDVVSA